MKPILDLLYVLVVMVLNPLIRDLDLRDRKNLCLVNLLDPDQKSSQKR